MNKEKISNSSEAIEFNPFEGPEIQNSFYTIEPQLEIWTSCKLGGDDANRAFNESLSIKFEGVLNLEAFELALKSLVNRHESLRSAFTKDGSKMIVFKEIKFNYHFEDISHYNQTELDNAIKQSKLNDVLYVFDLLNGPLFKFSLYKLSSLEYFFTVTAHHIICDGWSIGLLIQDLSKFYSAYSQKITPVLPKPDLFSEYAKEQLSFSNSNEYSENENFWLAQFKENIPVLNIPTDFPRPSPRTYKSSRLDFVLDDQLVAELKNIGIKEGCSFVNTLLASFELFLHSYSGQQDIIIGLPTAGQLVSGYYGLVGHCVSLLPIRSYPNTELSFPEYLKARKSSILDAYEHQRLTFSSLLNKLNIPRQSSRIPLVPVVFNIDMEIEGDTDFHQLNFDIFSNPREYENFELYLNVWGSKSKIQLEWSYNSQLFKKETVERMMQDFENLLRYIVSNPNQALQSFIHINKHPGIDRKNPIVDIEQSKKYWIKIFEGELPILEFPLLKKRSLDNAFLAKSYKNPINKELKEIFKQLLEHLQLSEKEGYPCLAIFLLYKYSGKEDFITGFQSVDTKSEVAIRNFIQPNDSFIKLLQSTRDNIRDAIKYQDYSLKKLSADLSIERPGNSNPFYDVKIVYQSKDNEQTKSNLELDLLIKFEEKDNGISLEIEYNGYLTDDAIIKRMAAHIESLLKNVLLEPDLPLNALEYMSDAERHELLHTFNNTNIILPEKVTIIDLFEQQVIKSPQEKAIVFENEVLTYTLLNEKANQLGNYLRKEYGIVANDLIGIQLERSEWMMIAILGLLKSGGAYVPIDPQYPEERIKYLKQDCNCKVVIDETELNKFKNIINQYSKDNIEKINTENDLAYVIYTSGSTGLPKGVMVEHKNVIRLVVNPNFIDFKPSLVLLATGALSFDATTFEYWSMLLNGGLLVICPQSTLLNIKLLSQEIKKHNVKIMWFTSGWLNQLIEADISLFSNLDYLLAGGDKLSPVHINKLRKFYPQLKIINGYGPTENTTFSLTYSIESELQNIPIGKPINNSTAYIVDKFCKLVPIGIEGEILLGGRGVTRGYLNQPTLTKEKFIPNPFKEGDILYKSGDIGKWNSDGNIEFIGRNDNQIKLRGYRIELSEIENNILKYKNIDLVIVKTWQNMNGEQSIVAYFKSSQAIDKDELKIFLAKQLPNYMIPIFFKQVAQFSLTPNGKIDMHQLPNPLEIDEKGTPSVENISKVEEIILTIWRELLGLKSIHLSDNFFEIGGHSLIAIRFIIKLENELGIKLPMSSLFEYPTIQKLAELIKSNVKAKRWKSLVPIKSSGSKPPIYLIHGGGLGVLIFSNIVIYLDKEQPVYELQALGIDGLDEPLDSIEEMAAFYISEIMEQNPEGPYALAGLSAGGLIAFEMAHQLKRKGKLITTLAIFDFDLYEIEKYNNNDLKSKIYRLLRNLVPIIFFNIKSIYKYPSKTIQHYMLNWKLRAMSLKRRLGFKNNVHLEGMQMDLQKAMVKNDESFKKYQMIPYEGKLELFIAKEKVYFQKDPHYMGWQPYALGGVCIYEVEGDHDNMILPPNNKNFALTLQKILDDNAKS